MAKEKRPRASNIEGEASLSKKPKRKQSGASPEGEASRTEKPKYERKQWSVGDVWSKSKKKRMRQLKVKQLRKVEGSPNPTVQKEEGKESKEISQESTSKPQRESSSLQKSFKARLSGSRFRELNEELYTTTSSTAFQRFSSKPVLYEQYHEGFRKQVEQWPVNPVNVFSHWLISRFQKHASCVVADFGCGDAALAQKLLDMKYKKKCPFVVHSFDLVAASPLVTACDMANVPLEDKTVDVAVFCLSLMGTNLADFVREAHRVLKNKGILKVAEVRSRFESTSNKDELNDFVKILDKLGFECHKTDTSNKMFVLLELKKNGKQPDLKLNFTAKPCIYKRR